MFPFESILRKSKKVDLNWYTSEGNNSINNWNQMERQLARDTTFNSFPYRLESKMNLYNLIKWDISVWQSNHLEVFEGTL